MSSKYSSLKHPSYHFIQHIPLLSVKHPQVEIFCFKLFGKVTYFDKVLLTSFWEMFIGTSGI